MADISNTELLERIQALLIQERFIRLPEVMTLTGLGRSSIYNRIRENTFPAGRKLSGEGRATVWLLSEVNGWIFAEIEAQETKLGGMDDIPG